MAARIRNRRLFVGDLHGCRSELDDLLERFGFRPGEDSLYSVGDVVGKGPDVPGTLRRLRELEAGVVRGNHDQYLLKAAASPDADRNSGHSDYLSSLGSEAGTLIPYVASWPTFLEFADVILVHAGLEPGKKRLADMSNRILTEIRTWDGVGAELNRPGDPPWFACVETDRTVVFGHWARRGLVDLPRFKGLDTGCVYGGQLTGWCPEEDRFVQVKARKTYSPVHFH